MNQDSGTNGQKIFRVTMKKDKLSKRNKGNRVFPSASELIFKKWLDENSNKFNHKPISRTKGGFYFKGITKAITLHIDFRQPEAMLRFEDVKTNETYDYYAIEYIGNEKSHPDKGFYDADRVDHVYNYYNTYAELLITEVFDKIIQYCNKNFREENSLYLINYTGCTEGFIGPSDEKSVKKINKLGLKNNQNSRYVAYKLLI